uniref:Uncharacterized protein n=1 Tax=viral metagenome TaxID=1070528 RepID=A0A6M3KLC6_9ZZZZ
MNYQTITLKGNAKVTVDFDDTGKCKKCGMDIIWATTQKAKSMPICKDKDGFFVSHFANCPYSEDFRKKEVFYDPKTKTGGVQ